MIQQTKFQTLIQFTLIHIIAQYLLHDLLFFFPFFWFNLLHFIPACKFTIQEYLSDIFITDARRIRFFERKAEEERGRVSIMTVAYRAIYQT